MFLRINGWESHLRFSAAHFIPSHDKCSRLHGHDYAVSVTVYGDQEKEFLIDFLELKNIINRVIAPMDHRVLVPSRPGLLEYSMDDVSCTVSYGHKKMVFSKEDVFLLDAQSSSSEEMSSYIGQRIAESLRKYPKIRRLETCIEEGPGMGACAEISINHE